MISQVRYRILLPVIHTVAAILFGGVGLWQRHAILDQRFMGNQTMWDTTARFHVWPLPYRLAVISNVPAFLTAGFIEWPLSSLWPRMSELVGFALFVLCVPVLWYFLGKKFDKTPLARHRYRTVLLSFTVLSVAAMFTPGYIAYLFTGSLLWVAFVIVTAAVGHPGS